MQGNSALGPFKAVPPGPALLGALLAALLATSPAACGSKDDGLSPECYGAGWENDNTGPQEGLRFSFAIMTDIHIGEGFDDFGEEGYDDQGSDHNAVIDIVNDAVDMVNANIDAYDIRFVMVLGDLTGSAEKSEFVKAREILDRLDVPYFPAIGNHDMWPYYWTPADTFVEAPEPVGDAYFKEVFGDHLDALAAEFPDLTRAPTPCHNPEFDITSHFINYSFTYMGYHFIVMDLVTRTHAPSGYPGVGPEGALHDFECGTWRWFTDHIENYACRSDHNIMAFVHHPPLSMSPFAMTAEDIGKMTDFISGQGYGDNIYGFFAGHLHLDLDETGFDGQHIVVTAATKEGAGVRVVRIQRDGTIDYSTLIY